MSRFLLLALVASTAAAALSLTAPTAHAAPAVPSGCAWQSFIIGGLSTCAPGGSVNSHQVEVVCHLLGGIPYMDFAVWGPEAPTFLPSIALCPPLHVGLGGTVHAR